MSEATITPLETGLTRLRESFPPETIGKLPKVTCKDCSDKDKTCSRHTRKKCSECGAFLSEAHVHIDFVGHAPVTDRLLNVDPHWNWEPFAIGADGLPAVVKNDRGVPVGMWIKLTVLGVTRPGYGSCLPGPEAMKELIGDAIRNAAMRFGVALDLWSKTELESQRAEVAVADYDGEEKPAAPARRTGGEALARARSAVRSSSPSPPPLPADEPTITGEEADELKARLNALDGAARAEFKAAFGHPANLLAGKLTSAREFVAAREGGTGGSHEGKGAETPPAANVSDQPARALVTQPAPAPQLGVDPNPMTDKQKGRLFALLSEAGVTDRAARHGLAASVLGHPVETFTDLTVDDATALIDHLKTVSA